MRERPFREVTRWGGVFLGLAIVVLAAATAHAETISIAYSLDGGLITSLGSSGIGNYSISGTSIGAFTFNNISGTGFPILSQPQLSTNSLNVQSTDTVGHTLDIFITQQGLNYPSGVNAFLSSFNSQTFSGSISSVLEQTFIDPTNGLWGGTLLASQNFTGVGSGSSTNNSPSLGPGWFSETAEYTINTSPGSGNVNDTIDINLDPPVPSPEPGTLTLLSSGLIGLGLIRRRLVRT